MERFTAPIVKALNTCLGEQPGFEPILASDLDHPPNPELGDFAFPCFRLAKSLRKAPPAIAQELAQRIQSETLLPKECSIQAIAEGPYLNFKVSDAELYTALLTEMLGNSTHRVYSAREPKTLSSWVLEYSSPNLAKVFNIYHLRGTVLGAALARIGSHRGFKVERINHLGDWGTQWGKLAVAFKLHKDELPKEPRVEDLVEIYVKFHQDAENMPHLEEEARLSFLKLEQGDPEMRAVWEETVKCSLKDFQRIYKRIGVDFDYFWGESFYQDKMAPLLQEFKDKGILEKDQGAQVVFLTDEKGNEIPPCILVKQDGATIYATRDVAAAKYRWDQFHFDRMSYIVGGEQRLHFQQVFGVLMKAGYEWSDRCEHIATGLYRFKDAKMSTRKGNFVTLENVLDAAKDHVLEIMKTREGLNLSEVDIDQIAEKIAVGAIVFNDLSVDPARDVEFDLARVVDFEGETGPYLQYAHTRCLGIIRKAKKEKFLKEEFPLFDDELVKLLKEPQESQLVRTLGRLPFTLDKCVRTGRATPLAHLLIDMTKAFNSFYRECRVLGEDEELSRARLMLVGATKNTLGLGLGLLGIPLPERM